MLVSGMNPSPDGYVDHDHLSDELFDGDVIKLAYVPA